MREIYNFTSTGTPKIGTAQSIFIFVFAFFIVVSIIHLISAIRNDYGLVTHFKQFWVIVIVFAVSISYYALLAFYHNDNKKVYEKCVAAYNNLDYLSEEGKIDNLLCNKRDYEIEYSNINFQLNSLEVTPECFKAFGDFNFTEEEIELLKNTDLVKVEYVLDNNENVIVLTMSVYINET